ncbi:hypothetical protein BBJ29_000258 [Phytophthora kernoviae]|uniref:OB domain-containing protein n=1 Tax=Phytophthora kernoviae TaxID=325452 RepID=A0A3F2RC80_9STRA|nr:hypothetical protein BBP00_00009579 [Phytophthora kernoviae]RLN70717.1 hypothetical protein BBJ29_000258 [Phytophthora kernoviae]
MVWSSFTALRTEATQWTDEKALQSNLVVEGQLIHQRRISRKCSFFDLASVAAGSNGERERLEVILKIIDDELSLEEVDAIRYRLKVGDIVHIRGFVERLDNGTSILRPMKLSKMQHKYLKKRKKEAKQCNQAESALVEALVPQVQTLFNTGPFLEDANNAQLVNQASLLLGMHPDEATDAILDVAIKLGKPFAVVPCCVFGNTFPERRLANGSKVLSYENLVEYLEAKHPNIEKAFLPFDGKNLVLFRRPQTSNDVV